MPGPGVIPVDDRIPTAKEARRVYLSSALLDFGSAPCLTEVKIY